tara:strand:+ start:675 stop:2303 length:1629 start_codon:yes stop_codon:yes gene_type:complete
MIAELITSYCKKNKVTVIAYLCVVMLGVFSSFFLIPKYSSALMSSFTTGQKAKNLLIAVVFAYVLGMFTDVLRKYCEDSIVPDFTEHVREHIYKIVMESHSSDRQVELGKLLNVMSNFPYVVRNAAIDFIRTYFPYFGALVILMIYFFTLDKNFGILQVVTFIVYCLTIWISRNSCVDTAQESYVDFMNLSESVQDKLLNIDSIYAAQQEKSEIDKYNDANHKNIMTYQKSLRTLWKIRVIEETLLCISFIVFNYMIYKMKLDKKTAIALYVGEIYYFLRILQYTQVNLLTFFTLIGEANAMSDFMNELVNSKDKKDNAKSNKKGVVINPPKKNVPSLTIENAWYRYESNQPWVLKNFNFSATTGDRIWIKGSSGCGKSTLFKLILGGLKLNKGIIKLFGNSDINTIRENTSVVDQHTKLFHDTVMNNILYGNKATEADVRRILKKLGTNIYDKLPDGLHSDAGVGGENLSGGQRQLTILLRCYFRPASLVLMDEPISAIDEENMEIILKAIDLISTNRTLLVISHSDKIRDVTNKVVDICG